MTRLATMAEMTAISIITPLLRIPFPTDGLYPAVSDDEGTVVEAAGSTLLKVALAVV